MKLQDYRVFFRKAHGRFSQVLFTGGEPTLRRDFADILIISFKEGKCSSASIFTNGLLCENLSEIIQRVLKESKLVLSLQFSIDGLQLFNDTNRGVEGAMKKTLYTINRVKELRDKFPKRFARISVATAISKRNLEDLSAIIKLVEATGILHSFGFVRGSNVSVFNLEHKEELSRHQPINFSDYLSVQDMETAFRVIERDLWSKHKKSLYYTTNRTILGAIKESMQAKAASFYCMAGIAELTLLPNGDICRCEMLKSCANLKDFNWDLEALIKSPAFKNNFKKTSGCWCTHECSIGTSIMYDRRLLNNLFVN